MNVLILTSFPDSQAFRRSGPGRVLLRGLRSRGIDWTLHQPWQPRPDLEAFDIVLSWPYGLRHNAFLRHGRQFEDDCRRRGVQVVNSLATFRLRHSHYLSRFRSAGIPCAEFQRFTHPDEITLPFPLVLRTDGIHRGRNMFLVRDRDDVRRAIDAGRCSEFPPLDLAIRFIDVRWADGYCRKRRSYVIGDRVLPRQQALSRGWIVNLGAAESLAQAEKEDRHFLAAGEENAELVRRAAQAVDAELIALDYSQCPDGSYVFWEGNRNFNLSVRGAMMRQFLGATGRTREEARRDLLTLGETMADLVIARCRSAIRHPKPPA